MKKLLILLLSALISFGIILFLPLHSANAKVTSKSPSLVIIGGALRYDNAEVFQKMIALAGGNQAKIAIFPTASSSPLKTGKYTIDAFNKYGAKAIFIPVAIKNIDVDYKQAVQDSKLITQVKDCTGIFFTGGDQARITQALYTESGERTPMLNAIWDVYKRGGVIAGSSAGAAIMSTTMFTNAVDVLGTLKLGVKEGDSIDKGLGFIGADVFIDQHFLIRGRFARALVAMQQKGYKLGLGVDENTAMVVNPTSGDVQVIGYKGALVLDLSAASKNQAIAEFNLQNVKLTYLDRGDQFNFKTKVVKPHPLKLNDKKIDPKDSTYKPYYTEEIFDGNILGNTTVVDVMSNLIDNSHQQAIGLAFTTAKDIVKPELGFEFKFRKDADSLGYYTGAFGGENYTVENIYLDITPIKINQRLYQ